MLRRGVLLLLLLCGCSKKTPTDELTDAAAAMSVPPTASSPAAVAQRPLGAPVPATYVEAARARVTKLEDDPALLANADVIRKHFGGAVPSPLVVQTAELFIQGRRAILIADAGKTGTQQDNPMVLVVDDRNAVLWTKEKPGGGIMPPVGRMAIAPGPKGRVALAVCDAPTSSVALREWDDDSTAFADHQAMDVDACDDVSILWWPKHGWLLVAARRDGLRAQLVSPEGRLEWGRGLPVGARWRSAPPAALAADTDDSFVLVQYAGQDQDHAMAYRYDAKGQPLWPNASDFGEVPRVPAGQEHAVLRRDKSGLVHVKLAARELDLASSGEIVKR